MSGALTRLYELAELAKLDHPLEAVISVDQLTRFVEALGIEQDSNTQLKYKLETRAQSDKTLQVNGLLDTEITTVCRRCLGGVKQQMAISVEWEIEQQEVRLQEWVEDELILSLPSYPHHADGACDNQLLEEYKVEELSLEEEVTHPFAGLKDLLNKE